MNKTLSVSAIQNGTVIDHINPGMALRIISMLRLLEKKYQVTVGMNLSSKTIGLKDLIKIENHNLDMDEANKIMIFAPNATINIIKNTEVIEKIITQLPPTVSGVFACPNPVCITNAEAVESFFTIEEQGKFVKFICKFCEKTFDRNQVKVRV